MTVNKSPLSQSNTATSYVLRKFYEIWNILIKLTFVQRMVMEIYTFVTPPASFMQWYNFVHFINFVTHWDLQLLMRM